MMRNNLHNKKGSRNVVRLPSGGLLVSSEEELDEAYFTRSIF